MPSLFDTYLEAALEDQQEQPVEPEAQAQPTEETPKEQPPEEGAEIVTDAAKRKITLLSWAKKLNAQFKPYAVFKIITETNSKGVEDTFLSLKPKGYKEDKHFFHITGQEQLSKNILKEIVTLAEKQLKQMASVNEGYYESYIPMRARNGWKKKPQPKKVIVEYANKDKGFIMDILSPENPGFLEDLTSDYAIIVYDKNTAEVKRQVRNIKNINEVKAQAINMMNTL